MAWTKEEIMQMRQKLGLDQADFAKLLGVDNRSVVRWETGESTPTGSAEAILNGIREKISKDPDSLTQILTLIGGIVAVGGLAYLIIKLLDSFTSEKT